MTARDVYTYDARLGDVYTKAAASLAGEVHGRDRLVAAALEMRRELDRDAVARLRREVDAPKTAAAKRAFLDDPAAAARVAAAGIAAEVHNPTLLASARRARAAREAASWRRTLVASCLSPGLGDLSRPFDMRARLETGLRAAVVAGDRSAEPLLASVVHGRGRDINRAITASGYKPSWKITRVGEHHKATWTVFEADGRTVTHTRWKFRGMGGWLTEPQFRARVDRARQRDRQLRRQQIARR